MSYDPGIDHEAIVAQMRARFPASAISAEDCVRVLNAAALELTARGEDAGLLEKSSGNRACFDGACYSVDTIVYRDGQHFDALIDAGANDHAGTETAGAASPAWQDKGPIDPARWRPPTSAIPAPPEASAPAPAPAPGVQCPQYSPVSYEDWLDECRTLADVYQQTDHNPDHLAPAPADVGHWGYRRFIELWTYENLAADIREPGSVIDGICSARPEPEATE